MAAHSPVVLDSSSPPPPFRHPSITPQKSAKAHVSSSSPGLPELSFFFNTSAKVPAAEPKASLPLPGFTSAGAIWNATALKAEQKEGQNRSDTSVKESDTSGIKSTGKLVRATRKPQTEKGTASRTRTPSISLPEFDFKPDDSPDQMQPPNGREKDGKCAVKAKIDGGSGRGGNTVNRAKGIAAPMRKSFKRATKSKSDISKPNDIKKEAKEREDISTLAPSTSTQNAPKSAEPETSRSPSISISEFSYRDAEPVAMEQAQQTSAYFSPSFSDPFRILEQRMAKLPESAEKCFAPSRASAHEVTTIRHITGSAAGTGEEVAVLPEKSARKPSVSLSELDYRPEGHSAEILVAASIIKTSKKPRKGTSDARTATHAAPVKKPKKKFTKSASIILNSDEPDAAAGECPHTANDRRQFAEAKKAAVYASKAKGISTAAKPIDNGRLTTPVEAGFGVWSQSAYFDLAPLAKSVELNITSESLQTVFAANMDIHTAPQVPDSAGLPASPLPQTSIPRRRSWTPANNTYETLDAEVDSSGESPAPKKSLVDLVGDFGYDQQMPPRARSPPGEPLLKKRRIDVEEESAALLAPRKVKLVKEKVKRIKAPKKKPQTITDLATKAYRTEKADLPNPQSTVSAFFAAQKDDHSAALAAVSAENGEAPPTFKKQRKPRAKNVDKEASATKKTPKPKKVKVGFVEAPALLSPQQARAKEQKQGFLFGTSSQLALEEDFEYVRNLQMAIMESETGDVIVTSPRKVFTKVSVGHAERRLFWSASRDSWGHVIPANGVGRNGAIAASESLARVRKGTAQSGFTAEPPGDESHPLPDTTHARQDRIQGPDNCILQPEGSQVVDLCATSPTGAADDDVDVIDALQLPVAPRLAEAGNLMIAPAAEPPGLDDSWALLDSDDTDILEHVENTCAPPTVDLPNSGLPPTRFTASQQLHSASCPKPSHGITRPRTALTTLDSNIAIISHTSPARQRRGFSQTSQGSLGSPRKGPSEENVSISAAALSPKRRGRPPKSVNPAKLDGREQPRVSASQAPLSSDFVAIDDISDCASEDVPLIDILAVNTALKSPKRRGSPPKASQQSPATSPSKSSFVKLDDISDSDVAKHTPSPRRRKAGATSPVGTLELSPWALKDLDLPPVADGKSAIKSSDSCWLPVSKVLFPQISAIVQSTEPCGENGQLSWWEKILMYDPIVLEDLTAWLDGCGVGVRVRRKAVKEKKKGRKKKEEVFEEQFVQTEEFEVVKEELKGWMVQKWCEEKSICCLWREGLRGGVKVRY